MRRKILAGVITGVLFIGVTWGSSLATILTMQNFEDGNLTGWTAGGRQIAGSTNEWGVSEYAGSEMAYLYHRGFTELNLWKPFSYQPDMMISFDAVFSIDGDTSPTPSSSSQWDSYNVFHDIGFRDEDENLLGRTRYVAETTTWMTDVQDFAKLFYPNGLQHYEYDITALASDLSIDSNTINEIFLSFGGYSPIAEGPFYEDWHTMEVRFDNVSTSLSSPEPVPEPSTILLLSAGIAGFALWRLRR